MHRLAIVLTSVLCTALFVHRATAEEKSVEVNASLGATVTEGNSETTLLHGSLTAQKSYEHTSVRGGIEGNYGESEIDEQTETTTENAKADFEFRREATERSFLFVSGSLLYDDIADIDYRGILNTGCGYTFVKRENTTFLVELGPSYVWEEVGGEQDDYLSARAAERLEHRLSEHAKLWQSAEYIPELADFGNYLLNAEIGIEAALNSRANIRFVVRDRYQSEPAPDTESNDLTMIAAIGFRLF